MAPILLFYTAGYEYNLKKRLVEKSGVLIVDGTPKNATIFIDGTDTGKTIPYTFQHVTPGWHNVTASKQGFTRWEKRLEVRAEQVTFTNTIHLWPTSTPLRIRSQSVLRLEADPRKTRLAVIDSIRDEKHMGVWNPREDTYQTSTITTSTATIPTDAPLRWNSAGTAFILNGITRDAPSYWTTTDADVKTDQLPTGIYTWSDASSLTGSDDESMVHLQTRSNRFARTPLSPPYVFRDQDIRLQKTTSTPAVLLLTKTSLEDRVYQLTNTNLRLVDRFKDLLILEDPRAHEWFALALSDPHPYGGSIQGDYPRWFQDPISPDRTRALLVRGGELWLWEPGKGAILLWRQAEHLTQALWNKEGTHVILADARHVFALELDDRDGRITTPLAEFEHISDIALLQDVLYVSGQHQTGEGVFTIAL